jgi:hypothetical protein
LIIVACGFEAPVNWTHIAKDNKTQLDTEFLPKAELKVILNDPSRMLKAELLSFYTCWYDRQESNELPLWFKNCKKARPEYQPDSADEGSPDEDRMTTQGGEFGGGGKDRAVQKGKGRKKGKGKAGNEDEEEDEEEVEENDKGEGNKEEANRNGDEDGDEEEEEEEEVYYKRPKPKSRAKARIIRPRSASLDIEKLATDLIGLTADACWVTFVKSVVKVAPVSKHAHCNL